MFEGLRNKLSHMFSVTTEPQAYTGKAPQRTLDDMKTLQDAMYQHKSNIELCLAIQAAIKKAPLLPTAQAFCDKDSDIKKEADIWQDLSETTLGNCVLTINSFDTLRSRTGKYYTPDIEAKLTKTGIDITANFARNLQTLSGLAMLVDQLSTTHTIPDIEQLKERIVTAKASSVIVAGALQDIVMRSLAPTEGTSQAPNPAVH